uniref:Uncharacterized protein n=1 Tax=Anguilla anguilla TaxID=7936 RepID=A0A0E9W969_ANGAN
MPVKGLHVHVWFLESVTVPHRGESRNCTPGNRIGELSNWKNQQD